MEIEKRYRFSRQSWRFLFAALDVAYLQFFALRRNLGMSNPEPLRDPPKCIKCGEKLRFSCTEIEKPGFVHHVYECKKCRSTQSFVTAK
jgi:hypothetical protein